MQNNDNPNNRPEGDNGQSDGRKRLIISRDLMGPLSLLVVIVGGIVAYYAYYYVGKDSARIQFWISFMFSFMALVVIIVQVVIYAQQAEFMRQQARTSAQLIDLMVINERAYLRISNWKRPRFENGEMIVTGVIANGGKTPAWNVWGMSYVGVGSKKPGTANWPPVEEWPQETAKGGAIIGGGDLTFDAKPVKVSDDDAKALKDGALKVFIDGVCSYFDSLGGRQLYAYGFTITLKPSRFLPRYEHHHRVQANPN